MHTRPHTRTQFHPQTQPQPQYQHLNNVYRALDIYNFPTGITLQKQLESIRILNETLNSISNSRKLQNLLPSSTEIQTRLQNLSYEIYNTRDNTQLLHELMDTAMEMGAALPTLELDAQQNLFREYERYTVRADKPKPKDIYSLEAIVEDSQNVHHTSINEHMKTLVRKLVQDHPIVDSARDWVALKNKLMQRQNWKTTNLTSLKFIYETTCTFTIGITLKQLILSVFHFIQRQNIETQDELLTRLNEELDDMRNKCSTGHLSRLVNVVQGFSEQYTLNIQPKEEIKAFIYHYLTKRLKEAPDSVQDGMLEQTQEYQKYVLNEKHVEFFQERFGTDHTEWIQTCMKTFVEGK